METSKPIKRSPAIAEFSRDHHFTLLLVWKMRQGFNKSIKPERISKYALHYIEKELLSHFKEEEELLFSKLPAENNLRVQAESEHKTIYQMSERLKENPADMSLLRNFADTLEKHVRFEERQLFNYLQTSIPEDELLKVAASLKVREHEDESAWEDAFWVKGK